MKGWRGEGSLLLTGGTGTGKTHLGLGALRAFPPVYASEYETATRRHKHETALRKLMAAPINEDFPAEAQGKRVAELEGYLATCHLRPARVLFVPAVQLWMELAEAAGEGSRLRSLERMTTSRHFDAVCIDDVGAERWTEAVRQALCFIIDARYREMLPTVVTSNLSIEDIDRLEPRVASRLAEMGRVLELGSEDYRLRRRS